MSTFLSNPSSPIAVIKWGLRGVKLGPPHEVGFSQSQWKAHRKSQVGWWMGTCLPQPSMITAGLGMVVNAGHRRGQK